MRTLFDTSVIIAALIEAHPMHQRAFPWLKQANEHEFELIDSKTLRKKSNQTLF
jgi:predicted nucleic acid-binding protein